MLKNYFNLAWRGLIRDRQFSFLNLVGLSTGLACALLIFLWVKDERSIDKFHEKDKQLYQVMQNNVEDDEFDTDVHTPGLLAKSLLHEMPEVEDAVVVAKPFDETKGIVSFGDFRIKATELYVSPNFFDVFSYHIIQGNKSQILTGKYNVLLSEEMALKLFHTTNNIIGKTIEWDRGVGYEGRVNGSYAVSGLFEKPPVNSTAQFDLLFTYDLYFDQYKENLSNWGNSNPSTYVVLKKGTDVGQFNVKIKNFRKEKIKSLHGNVDWLKWIGTFFIQRYSDRYLYNKYENGVVAGGRIQYVKLFSIIAIFILIIACINFMNLATAKASGRMKEVGVRKVIGAGRRSLVLQYMSESLLMSFLSLLIAIALVALLLPAFNEITGKQILINTGTRFIVPALTIALITGILSGSYPALYLSGFKPALVLKGKLSTSGRETGIRKGLVVSQFALSMIFIVSVLVIYQQTNYIQSKNLGYNKDNVIRFNKEGKLRDGLETFLTEIKEIPGVINASNMGGDMTGMHGGTGGLGWEGKNSETNIEFEALWVDYEMMETLGLQMAKGRTFSNKFGSDSFKIIFNEAAIAAMGLKDPVGKTIKLWGKDNQIIGVTKDFHFESLHESVKPFFFKYNPDNENIFIRIKGGKEKEAIAGVEKLYKQFNPGLPFEYRFLDDDYRKLYASEQRIAVLSKYFAGLAIIISCLGLFGLAAFTAQKRQKEIGIRKVVGASVSNIAAMLSKDFLKLVLIAILIAFPLAWWAMNEWLKDYAYRINIGPAVFLIAGASIIFITLLTISFQSIKAALTNPVKSLRTE